MEITIPVVDKDVSSDDPSGAGVGVFEAIISFVALFGVVGVASMIYNKARAAANVDEHEVPGI